MTYSVRSDVGKGVREEAPSHRDSIILISTYSSVKAKKGRGKNCCFSLSTPSRHLLNLFMELLLDETSCGTILRAIYMHAAATPSSSSSQQFVASRQLRFIILYCWRSGTFAIFNGQVYLLYPNPSSPYPPENLVNLVRFSLFLTCIPFLHPHILAFGLSLLQHGNSHRV